MLAVGVAWIVVMTCDLLDGHRAVGPHRSRCLLAIEVFTLALFAVVALVKVYARQPARLDRIRRCRWFNPFGIASINALVGGVLLGIFIYWGWDSGVAVNEETEDAGTAPGKSAVLSTSSSLARSTSSSTVAAQAFGGAADARQQLRRHLRARSASPSSAARSTSS